MNIFKMVAVIIGSLIATSFIAYRLKNPGKRDLSSYEKAKGFAVLELFTSEGCSSCPPADALIAAIQKDSKQGVFILTYHVDYWDHLGWKDPFSNAIYSDRQKQYGKWLNTQQIYTPQLVINGHTEFVGSDELAIRMEISKQLGIRPEGALNLEVQKENGKYFAQYHTGIYRSGSHLLIALVQKSARSLVTRGENAGKELTHVQIVQKLQDFPLSSTGDGSVKVIVPSDFSTTNWEIIGMIQNQRNGEILAVSDAVLIQN